METTIPTPIAPLSGVKLFIAQCKCLYHGHDFEHDLSLSCKPKVCKRCNYSPGK